MPDQAHAFEHLPPLPVREGVTPDIFREEIQARAEPVVLRGLVSHWPGISAGAAGTAAMARYLSGFDNGRPAETIFGPPEIGGRFFYSEDLRGLNFSRRPERISRSLQELVSLEAAPSPPSIYVQSIPIADHLPGLLSETPLPLLPASVSPRIWIGNRLTVQTHFDLSENIACVVAGRRRFTLFPPHQLKNLYVGPFEHTLAGPPVSLVRPESWNPETHPRFAEALAHARSAELGPGDAIYIPYCWWHHVQSLTSFNVLVNYWWSEARPDLGSPFDAMLHALIALRDLPPREREVWRGMFDHYVFAAHGDPVAHLPADTQGALGPHSPEMRRKLKFTLLTSLAKALGLAPPPMN